MATTANMNLTLPNPTSTVGPTWATELNTAMETVDTHDHTAGKGTKVPAAGLNINADLDIQSHELQNVKGTAYTSQSTALSASKTNETYVLNGDLYYNNNAGVAVQVTAGSSVASASSPLVPSGVIWPYGGASAPSGFLLCNGSAVSRSTYADLFAIIGTVYGSGDGSTTFNLPNLIGRTAVGSGTYTDPTSGSVTRTLGTALGEEKHLLTTAETPSHTHSVTGSTATDSHSHTLPVNATGGSTVQSVYYLGGSSIGAFDPVFPSGSQVANSSTNTHSHSISLTSGATGNGTTHNIMQPSLIVNYIIKT